VGIIVQGGLYNTLMRSLAIMGLADIFGCSRIPIYVLNVTYPLVPAEVIGFASGKSAVLVVEEGQPEFIEQAIGQLLRKAGSNTAVVGKGPLPMAGEYSGTVMEKGLSRFLRDHAPQLLPKRGSDQRAVGAAVPLRQASELRDLLPPRPAGLCTGCPERPLFSAMKLVQRELGDVHVSADIGCHSFAALPPFNMGASIMGYGLGGASSAALGAGGPKRAISLMGDGGFWHNGLTSGIANSVFNKHDDITVIVDNGYAAATGGQYVPSSRADVKTRKARNPIERALRGVGVEWVRTIQTYRMQDGLAALREALTTSFKGPKVIIAEGECQLNRQRRMAPVLKKLAQAGKRVIRQRFGVDADVCTGDHSC